eukprot:scaffold92508_cov17-Tisochrysis_lutea.AAC.3
MVLGPLRPLPPPQLPAQQRSRSLPCLNTFPQGPCLHVQNRGLAHMLQHKAIAGLGCPAPLCMHHGGQRVTPGPQHK